MRKEPTFWEKVEKIQDEIYLTKLEEERRK